MDWQDRRQWKFSCEDRVAKSGSSWVSFGNSDAHEVVISACSYVFFNGFERS